MTKNRSNKVLRNLNAFEGFNNMDPQSLVKQLHRIRKYWKEIFWDASQDDTVILIPKGKTFSKRALLECIMIGRLTEADEINIMPASQALKILNIFADLGNPLSDDAKQLFNNMVKSPTQRVLRFWWD